MRTLSKTLGAVLFVSVTNSAVAIDLSTYPESLLGPIANAKVSLAKGTVACDLTGASYSSGLPVYYQGHVRLTHEGKADSAGFGKFLSPTGKESFVRYGYVYSTATGGGAYTDSYGTCIHTLDTETSKYTVNKYGQGISELHWNADSSNPSACPAFVDQLSWILDKSGRSVTTRLNQSPTTSFAAQTGSCFKGL